MTPTTDMLLREIAALQDENQRLTTVERELAVTIELLRTSEERLRLAVEAAQMGIWEWDIASNRVTWDAKKHDVFGLAHGSFAGTAEAFFELVHPADRESLRAAVADALDHGAPYQNEFRIVEPNGTIRWIANLGQVYRDDDGRPTRMLGVVHDITDRKATERALHDSTEKCRAIVETTREWISLNLNEHIEALLPSLRRRLGEDVALVTELSDALGNVSADPAQLRRLFQDLVVNAREAMPRGGTVTIATLDVSRDDGRVRRDGEVLPDDYVMVTVSDTGNGMTEAAARRIFEPFFSTKALTTGPVGLGLSACHGIVARHGGHIAVETRLGAGTTFRVYLPRVARAEIVDGRGWAAQIAIVDDDEPVRNAVMRLVRGVGFSAVAFSSSEEFLATYARGGRFGCLILDVRMPGMNGLELLQYLRVAGDAVPAIVMTGEPDSLSRDAALVAGAFRVFEKPALDEGLIASVKSALSARASR